MGLGQFRRIVFQISASRSLTLAASVKVTKHSCQNSYGEDVCQSNRWSNRSRSTSATRLKHRGRPLAESSQTRKLDYEPEHNERGPQCFRRADQSGQRSWLKLEEQRQG